MIFFLTVYLNFIGLETDKFDTLIKDKANAVNKNIKLDFNKDIMDLTETIQVSDLPNEFKVLIEHKHMSNTMNSKSTAINENTTLWTAEIDYFKVNFWPAKIIMRLFPNMFLKQGKKWSDNFKKFAEAQ